MESKLLIKFPDSSKSFCYGVEYGRILEQMEKGNLTVDNHGFPVRLENKELIEESCKTFGYTPSFGRTYYGECIEFVGIKNQTLNN
jgi:hypothetical protein